MAEINEILYEPQYNYRLGDICYNFTDSSHPSTFQSFASSGVGYIDQSIFPFERGNQPWAFGKAFTFFSEPSVPSTGVPNINVRYNTLSKNQGGVPFRNTISRYYWSGKDMIDHDLYSPLTPTLTDLTPWRNIKVNASGAPVLVPKFWIVDGNGTMHGIWDYATIEANHLEDAYVDTCYIYFYGSPSGNDNCNLLSIQYAGEMLNQVKDPSYPIYNIEGSTRGVYYHVITDALFEAYNYNTNLPPSNHGRFTPVLPFDITALEPEVITRADGVKIYALPLQDIIKVINSIGCYWLKSESAVGAALGQNCTNPYVVSPLIENHKVTDTVLTGTEIGDYARAHADDEYCWFNLDYGAGTDPITGEPLGKSLDEYIEDPDYNNDQSTVEPTEDINLNTPVKSTEGGNSTWLMTEEKVKEFFTWLWNPDGTIFDDIVKGCALLGENPMDSVVSLKMFPFSLYSMEGVEKFICFGRIKSTVRSRHLTESNVVVLDLGSFKFNDTDLYNDFRDYEPYSDYSLYIPFVGVIPLQAIECINTTISVKMIVDLIVGSCTTVIFTNGVPYKYIDGQIGIDMPVTGRNLAQYGRTILQGALAGAAIGGKAFGSLGASEVAADNASNGQYNLKMAKHNMETGAYASEAMETAKMGVLGALGTAMPAAGALAFTVGGAALGAAAPALLNNPAPQSAGCNAPATGLAKPLYPYFIVRRSDCWIPENYNHLYGRPVQEGGVVSDFHGFCKFGNLNLNGLEATETEKLMINDTLQNGVII